MGSVIGGLLARAEHAVTLVTRNDEHVRQIQRTGLRLIGEAEFSIPLRAATSCTSLSTPDLLIVLVKSFDTQAAIERAASIIASTSSVEAHSIEAQVPAVLEWYWL